MSMTTGVSTASADARTCAAGAWGTPELSRRDCIGELPRPEPSGLPSGLLPKWMGLKT